VFSNQITFVFFCANSCEAKGFLEQDGIGQFVYLTGKLQSLFAGFHKSTIFGCIDGCIGSF
jgi:hypothetical protein